MIKNFIIKFQSQTDTSQMQSLSLFIQNINTNWQTICNLPDLLEFAELIQYKQDQLMKNKFEQIYDDQNFSFKNEIANEINDKIRSNPVKNLTFFNKIQDEKNEDLRIRFSQIEQDIQDKLLAFKQDKQIQKKIYLKYLKQLSQRINSSLKDSEVIVFEEIKNIEREYQNKRGFKSLDDFILGISKDPDQLAQFKENEGEIKAAFNKLWGDITRESEQKQSEILQEYSTKQYQCISSSFNEYKLNTQNEQLYITSFLENINNNSPFRQDFDERMQIYNIFEKELKSQVQFRPIFNTKETMRYGEVFLQNLEDRMKRPNTKYDVMDIKNYYQFQIKVYYVEKKTLDDYIKKDKKDKKEGLIIDLIKILERSENNQNQPKGKQKQQQADQYLYQCLDVNSFGQQYESVNSQFQQYENVNPHIQQQFNVNTQNQQYMNVNTQVQKLLLLLDIFKIKYDSKLRIDLVETIQDPQWWKIWSSYNKQVINAFEKFQESFKEFKKQKQPLMDFTNDTFIKNIKEYNKGLELKTGQYIFSALKELEEFIQNFEHIIIYRDMTIIPNSSRYKQLESSLKYIQRKESSFQEIFRLNFINWFQTAMFEENQKLQQNENCQQNGFSKFQQINSWQMMYFSIYDAIKSEMTKAHQENDKKDNSDSEEISQQNTSLIKIIMSKIEQEIINYNKSFANFGIILSGIGERCIYYYSMLIIWRFTCYKKGKGVQESIQKFESLKENQLQKFIADIKQNKTEQSKLKAEAFICNFYKSYIQYFYRDNQTTFGTEIKNKNKMTSTELIKLLDKTILEDYQKDNQLKKYSDEQIVQYITDQTQFIENYVKNEVDKIEVEIKDLFENRLRKNLNSILEKINANVQQLRSHTDIQNPPIKSKEYFVNNENDNSNDEFYESKLFDLIISCLLGGQQKMSKFQIQKEYEEIFSIDSYQKIEVNIFDKSKFQESELQIQLLQPFATELSKQLNIHIQKAKNESLSLEKFNSYQELQTIKLNMIGCRHTCPMCKRKCDQSYSNDHKHKCSNGHQLRGMNGVLIENTPSLFTCDEMDDECLIETLETKVRKKWKDIRKIYDDWIFKGLDETDQQTIKEKMMKVWNQGTGQMICQQLKTLLKKDIKFVLKNNFQDVIRQPKIHYIFMLDDSGSMRGKRWEYAKSGCLGCMLEIQKNLNARVSVIIFNSYARTVINCESVNLVEMEKKIQLSGGGTDFGRAFQETFNLIIQHQNEAFEKTEILFYTDGEAAYPQQIKQFKELPEHQKARIFLHCSSEESNATTLQMIVNELNACLIKSELKQKFQVTELQKTWAEIVSREYHNLKG
ncbi:unnamed protein product [Paramecium primaurelia]|uniref:VWFA domain-containing protein n=1 Tax=Paramecium primaurelia TaxID=5886 RepID=A0A8S1NUM6_PARPR|nr:unnamed protein product [Paramecium primaurelia]